MPFEFSPEFLVFHTNGKRSRFFRKATQLKLFRAGLGTRWVTHPEYRREGPYLVLCFLLFFCVLCGVILNVY